jgi:hypothetical protein
MSTIEFSTSLYHNDTNCDLTVADAVWVGTALLHFHNPSVPAFSTEDITATVQNAHLTKGLQKSIYLHVNQHCVANRPPNSNRSCALFAVGRGDRRLFRLGDKRDPARAGAPTHPDWNKLPSKYIFLKDWYEEVWNGGSACTATDPLLDLIGSGAQLWSDEPADQYVANLRAGWEGRP